MRSLLIITKSLFYVMVFYLFYSALSVYSQDYQVVQNYEYLFEKGIEMLKADIPECRQANNLYTYKACSGYSLPCFQYSFDGYLGNIPGTWYFTAIGKKERVLTRFGRKKIFHFHRTSKKVRFFPYGQRHNVQRFNLSR